VKKSTVVFALTIVSLLACREIPPDSQRSEAFIHVSKFNQLLDSLEVKGAILIYDAQKEAYYTNDEPYTKLGKLPASTFKITNSIIALETGVVRDDSTLFEWNGEDRRLDIWERDMVFQDAFHLSCVPCYQKVAQSIGPERMNRYLEKLQYGNMQVDSSNVDRFWLEGNSIISQQEQIDFLRRFYSTQLPISERTTQLMKKLMVINSSDEYQLSGKTGWAIRESNNIGWFVGYLEKGNKVYYFATRIEPQDAFDMKLFPKIRKEITWQGFRLLGIID